MASAYITSLYVKTNGIENDLTTFLMKKVSFWDFQGTRLHECTHHAELFKILVKESFHPTSGKSQRGQTLLNHFFFQIFTFSKNFPRLPNREKNPCYSLNASLVKY